MYVHMLYLIGDRSTGPTYSVADSGSVTDSGGVCWVHVVWLVLSHVTPTQAQDGEGIQGATNIYTPQEAIVCYGPLYM